MEKECKTKTSGDAATVKQSPGFAQTTISICGDYNLRPRQEFKLVSMCSSSTALWLNTLAIHNIHNSRWLQSLGDSYSNFCEASTNAHT